MTDLRRIIWLASYPKSGNTWMRSLLAHYFMPRGQAPDINHLSQFTTGDIRQDFFDRAAGRPFRGSSYEEWMAVRPTALRMIAASKPSHHFVKTHCQPIRILGRDVIPAEVTAAAIYMMRNPFDLAPSFARHQGCDLDTAITRMMDPDMSSGTDTGIFEALGRWDEHVTTWTTAGAAAPRDPLRGHAAPGRARGEMASGEIPAGAGGQGAACLCAARDQFRCAEEAGEHGGLSRTSAAYGHVLCARAGGGVARGSDALQHPIVRQSLGIEQLLFGVSLPQP